jgi:hypothetical protein
LNYFILVSRNINNPQSQLTQKNIFCSVSSKADEYPDLIHFTLDKIDPHLCTHLLIDNHSSLLTALTSDQLKTTNSNLKILLTFNANENGTIEQWKEEMKKKKTDGINIHINANAFSDRITDLIKVFLLSRLNEISLFEIIFLDNSTSFIR